MPDVFSIGVTGLNAAKTAMDAIAQNVANANTPGYARQAVDLTTQVPTRTGSGFVGNGVMVTGIAAQVDPFLEAQVVGATADAGYSGQADSFYTQLQGIAADSASGVSTSVANFQTALGQAATNPSSIPARQLVLSNIQALASSLNSVATQLQAQKQGAAQSLSSQVDSANALIDQIAKLNAAIGRVESPSSNGTVPNGQRANDLRSQRQSLIDQLAQYAKISTVDQPEGTTVMMGGVAVVVSSQAQKLAVGADPLDPTQLDVGIATPAGSVPLSSAEIGGKIGATLDYVQNGIDPTLARLNQYAGVLAQSANDQAAKGVDMVGAPGQPWFTQAPAQAIPSSANVGSLSVSLSVNAYQTQGSDYRLTYSASAGYSLTRLSDNKVVGSSTTLPISADGLTLSVGSGAPADGDQFLIKPFGDQAAAISANLADPRQLALASPVASAASPSNVTSASITAPAVVSGLPLNPNLTSPVSIVFTSPTAYTISGAGIGTLSNQPYVSGQAISYNGWSVSINGAPRAGDSFSVGPSSGALGDAANANAMSAVLQGRSFGGGSQTLADLYANLQSDLGNKAAAAKTASTSDASVLSIAKGQRESYSGVNLDQEAADLTRWQQSYSANAQVLAIANKLFDDLISKF